MRGRLDGRWVLAAIVLIALALRLTDAGARLSHDEGYSWLVASAGSPGAFFSRLARYENTPPLFYLLLAPLPLGSGFWLRLPSILAGTAQVYVLAVIVRALLGARAALLAALGLAVAPFAVSFSDYSRGFMVSGLGVLVALLGAVRLSLGGDRRWWWAYGLGGIVAAYSEYPALIPVAGIVGGLLVLGPRPRRELIGFGAIPFAAFLPWIPELVRSQNQLGLTKLSMVAGIPGMGSLRDAVVAVVFGEHGAAGSAGLRWLQAAAVLTGVGWSCLRLWRSASPEASWLLAGVLVAMILGHLVVSAVDAPIFHQRYLTTMLGLGAAVVAGALSTLGRRVVAVAAGALLVGGVGVGIHRAGREYEPDIGHAVAVVRASRYPTILTNSAVAAFYGRDLHVVLDRPFGLGTGIERSCAPACAVLDDQRNGGVRGGPGPRITLTPLVLRFPPPEG